MHNLKLSMGIMKQRGTKLCVLDQCFSNFNTQVNDLGVLIIMWF